MHLHSNLATMAIQYLVWYLTESEYVLPLAVAQVPRNVATSQHSGLGSKLPISMLAILGRTHAGLGSNLFPMCEG
jgi:hypothetical protein